MMRGPNSTGFELESPESFRPSVGQTGSRRGTGLCQVKDIDTGFRQQLVRPVSPFTPHAWEVKVCPSEFP